jgi:hypothetical protein
MAGQKGEADHVKRFPALGRLGHDGRQLEKPSTPTGPP